MGVGGQRHAPSDLTPRKITVTYCTGGCVETKAGLDLCGKCRTHRDSMPWPPFRSSVAIPTELTRPQREGYTVDNFIKRPLRKEFGNNGRNLFVPIFGPQWKYKKYVTVQTEIVFVIIMHLFNYICGNKLLVPTIRHIIVIHILYMFSFSPSSFFRLAAILRQFTNKWLKIHSNKSVLTMLNMRMCSNIRTYVNE